MYLEWATLSLFAGAAEKSQRSSVLSSLPQESSREVVVAVVRHVFSTLGISQPPSPCPFETESEVEWVLQVICYGLSLPLTEHDIIKDCVSIYCEWLSCLGAVPKISVPKPLTDRPDFYARKIVNQLYHLFIPRKGEAQDTINRQAILCHRVLRVLQNTIKAADKLEQETWECILLFLIAINDAILSPPSIKNDIGDQLCERVLSVLFEVWLLACGKSFPSPPLWKTLRESCQAWRHRPNLFEQWNRINLLLTGRVLSIMYGTDYVKYFDHDVGLVPATITDDCTVQTWFRFLHCIGNPVELTQPAIISQTQHFLQFAISSEAVLDPCQHPCLSSLPEIFYQAMCGIAAVVDAFLGVPPQEKEVSEKESSSASDPSPVPPMRRLAKSFSVATSSSSGLQKGQGRISFLGIPAGKSKDTTSIPSSSISGPSSLPAKSLVPLLASGKPKVNSILHLFGPWLFEASLSCHESKTNGEIRRTSRGSIPAALPESIDIPTAITIDKYYQGRAEALGILCRIFCSKKTGEDILPSYLARFYIAVQKGLKETEVLISILSFTESLLRVDLDGVTVLVPGIVNALETVLPSQDNLSNGLRRSAIQLLLSMLSLPFHFLNAQVKEVLDKSGIPISFIQLKPRIANLLISALQTETDSVNIQMLLGGLLVFLTDTAAFEEIDKTCTTLPTDSPTNLLSSENASMRSFSDYSNSFDEQTLGGYPEPESREDSAHALFVRTSYLVCHRLISTWFNCLPVSLAALELLQTMCRIKIQNQDPLECRRSVKWICDFIINQSRASPINQSRDLHSSIVAAFQCVTSWLISHPYLLDDKETLYTVLEVVEYGISGTKSQGKAGEAVKFKDEKEPKPVSLRVRDAAETLLAVIFEQVGKYSPHNGRKNSSLMDEFVLLNRVHPRGNLSKTEIINHFRYYVMDNTVLIALFEEPLGNDQDPQPTVTTVIRGPTGRHAWTLQLRSTPRNQCKFSTPGSYPGRPLPINQTHSAHSIKHRYFPEIADSIVYCKADKAIPPLDSDGSLKTADQDALELSRLSIILENQIRLEKSVENMLREETDENYPLRTEGQPPPVSNQFQTARLLLSHLGLTAPQDGSDFSLPKLVAIDSTSLDFISELETLDSTSARSCDTFFCFYVRAGQKTKEEILSNVLSRTTVHPHFLEFLLSLGWPVNVSEHSGWTGNVRTSWKQYSCTNEDVESSDPKMKQQIENHGGSLYNGDRSILYWTDFTSEIAFVVPTGQSKAFNDSVVWKTEDIPTNRSNVVQSGDKTESEDKFQKLENRLESSEENRIKKILSGRLIDTKIMICWLESFDDFHNFPAGKLMSCTLTGLETSKVDEPSLIIYIHALKNGLFRIKMEGESLRMGLVSPLVDGMVVSRRILGTLVRQTSANMARRKRLENDNFQPPYVRRKLKIQEISSKFASSMSIPEFYTHFFH